METHVLAALQTTNFNGAQALQQQPGYRRPRSSGACRWSGGFAVSRFLGGASRGRAGMAGAWCVYRNLPKAHGAGLLVPLTASLLVTPRAGYGGLREPVAPSKSTAVNASLSPVPLHGELLNSH
jgi:hypothetical protein